MNLNAPDVEPIAQWCITALLCGMEVTYAMVPAELRCDEETFTAVMEEIIFQTQTGKPATLH